jgi:hypothetical protein
MTRPDPGTLDAMIQALDEDDDRPAWSWLVSSPDAAAAWDEAARHRADTDAFAEYVLARPKVASLLAAARRLPTPPHPAPALVVGRFELAMMRAAPPGQGRISLSWGRATTVRLPLEERVELETSAPTWGIAPNAAPVRLSRGIGWKLEPEDTPLLLLALLGAPPDAPFDEAVSLAIAIGGVLVLEQPIERGET